MARSSLANKCRSAPMPQLNDLSRSLVALDQDSTIIAVVELSQSSGRLPGCFPALSVTGERSWNRVRKGFLACASLAR